MAATREPTWRALRGLMHGLLRDDPATVQHMRATGHIAAAIGRDLGVGRDAVRHLRRTGTLHDLGKAFVDRRLLSATGRLAQADQRAVRAHVLHGRWWIQAHPSLRYAARVLEEHHERWDGAGYPCGLVARSIAWDARVVSVADALDAMVRGRPYASPSCVDDALGELREHAGTQFDPRIVAAVDDGMWTRTILAAIGPPSRRRGGSGAMLATPVRSGSTAVQATSRWAP